MNLKLWFLRLRDKMLVFVRCVKKCLQNGHSCRLAGVWLKCQNLRFACAVNRFCSSRGKKNIRTANIMIFNHPRQTSTHPFFFLFSKLQCPSAFWQRSGHRLQQGDITTPCPTLSPRVPFFCALAGFSCGAWALVWNFWSVSMYHPFVEYQQHWFYGVCSRTTSKMINLSSPPARWGLLDFIRAVLLLLE